MANFVSISLQQHTAELRKPELIFISSNIWLIFYKLIFKNTLIDSHPNNIGHIFICEISLYWIRSFFCFSMRHATLSSGGEGFPPVAHQSCPVSLEFELCWVAEWRAYGIVFTYSFSSLWPLFLLPRGILLSSPWPGFLPLFTHPVGIINRCGLQQGSLPWWQIQTIPSCLKFSSWLCAFLTRRTLFLPFALCAEALKGQAVPSYCQVYLYLPNSGIVLECLYGFCWERSFSNQNSQFQKHFLILVNFFISYAFC